jgi:hypothetical protein
MKPEKAQIEWSGLFAFLGYDAASSVVAFYQ